MTNDLSPAEPHGHDDLLVALVGQPNCGKSTIFSRLTGTHQRIGNYAGVTVEKRSATYRDGDWQIELVDLPGTYNLASYSPEEGVARNFILLERPELLLAVVDATDLRRHLRLVLQLLEMQTPLVICLNKGDIVRRRQITIDPHALEIMLGVPVVSVVATTGDGFSRLRDTIRSAATTHRQHKSTPWRLDYGPQIEPVIARLDASLSKCEHLMEDFSSRWLAVKLLEQDRDARRIVQHHTHDESWVSIVEETTDAIIAFEQEHGQRPAEVIAAMREAWTARLEQHSVKRSRSAVRRSDRIDAVVCRPVFGLFVAATVLMATFSLAFAVATQWTWLPAAGGVWLSPVDAVAAVFETWLPAQLDFWLELTPDTPLRSLICDGVLPGVGGVLQFVPIIFFVFLGVAFLEQSGYAARLVVVMDRLMRLFGLHGQSVIPLILGGGIAGGCAVPAVMAARTIRERRERLLTILIIPLMNCGAKLPVYALIVATFFAAYQGIVLASLVVISWGVAMCVAWVLTRTVVSGRPAPLAVELPAYQLPRLRDCLRTATQQSGWFVQKAGTVILVASIVLWFLVTFPVPTSELGKVEWRQGEHTIENSYAATIGKTLEPVSRFAGFDWRDNVAFLAGVAAKEVIVSTMAVLDAGDDSGGDNTTSLSHRLRTQKSLAGGVAMLLFVMFYAPCVATLAVIWRETQSFLWTLFAVAYTTLLAFAQAVCVFQVGGMM
ncbi:MAG: ferrous iron transport protein B [Thermoguttaceae bacterium]